MRVYGELHRYVPLLAKWEGYGRIGEKPVQHHARKFGRSKFGLERFLRGFLDLIAVVFQTRFAARPMHFFGTMGSLAFLVGFVTSVWISVDKLVFRASPSATGRCCCSPSRSSWWACRCSPPACSAR